MISQSAEYSLRAILCLASQNGSALTTHQIADAARIPPGYLAKVLQTLGRAGIVHSQRGLNGGFTLKPAPDRLTLLAIVSAVEQSHRITECPLGIAEHWPNLCPLHRRLDQAAAAVEDILRNTTIADVLAESRDNHLCPNKEQCHARHEDQRNR